MTEIWRKVEQN